MIENSLKDLEKKGSEKNQPLLVVDNIEASYGPFRALFGVSFTLNYGSSIALLGPNGAGKSTVARAISGLIRPGNGHIYFRGDEITGKDTWRIERLGVAHVPEGRGVFASLTVQENLKVFLSHAVPKKLMHEKIDEVYSFFPRLKERSLQRAETLSGGEQRMLALSRALVAPPLLLIADELSLGLAPILSQEVWSSMGEIRKKGTSIIVIEQNIDQAKAFADNVVELSRGKIVESPSI
ncbi:MAG: ABC transporter ATP-binding protein [Acidimicrobiales bacterium]|nr:ABC transporter ATP-binding protein [Acidimicrobiales bacterium]